MASQAAIDAAGEVYGAILADPERREQLRAAGCRGDLLEDTQTSGSRNARGDGAATRNNRKRT